MPFRVAIMYVLYLFTKAQLFNDLNRGGGIGGLTLAVALGCIQPPIDLINTLEVDIYEASSELTQIGAGITLWPRAWKILEQLGLGPSLVGHLSRGQQAPNDSDEPRKVANRQRTFDIQ